MSYSQLNKLKAGTKNDKLIDKLNKEYITGEGSRIMLTNNEIKDIMKVVKSLGNRRILLKGTTRKITSQDIFLSL